MKQISRFAEDNRFEKVSELGDCLDGKECLQCSAPADVPLPFGYSRSDAYDVYDCADDSLVFSYRDKTASDFAAVCSFYKQLGYRVYAETTMGENFAATLICKGSMAHVYLLTSMGELSIVTSSTAAYALPPKTPAVTDGDVTCTVAQMHIPGGMGYVVRLKDGSCIIIDGGYTKDADTLYQYLTEYCTGSEKPIVRAWLLTHSHEDHIEAFVEFANNPKYRDGIVLEHVIIAPLNGKVFDLNPGNVNSYLTYRYPDDVAKFEGTKTVFAHTGMEFTFCNLKMEILCTPENIKKGCSGIEYNTNELSIVARLKADGYSALFWGDLMDNGGRMLVSAYGDYLQSDLCHASHHGIDNLPADVYDHVRAPIMFYPVDIMNYCENGLNLSVRRHVQCAPYTKEILVADRDLFIRDWGTRIDEDAALSMPGFDAFPPFGICNPNVDPDEYGYTDTNGDYVFNFKQLAFTVIPTEDESGHTYDTVFFNSGSFATCMYLGRFDPSRYAAVQFYGRPGELFNGKLLGITTEAGALNDPSAPSILAYKVLQTDEGSADQYYTFDLADLTEPTDIFLAISTIYFRPVRVYEVRFLAK